MEPFTLEEARSDPQPARSRRAEFSRFDTEQRPRLIALLHALHGDRTFADRVATRALADAWLHWSDVRADNDPEGWVRRRARSVPARRGRRARVPDDEWIAENARPTLTTVLSLPMPERSVLVLHHIAGLDTARIAAEEHRTAPAVAELLARANRAVARSAGASPASDQAERLAQQHMSNLGHALSYRSDLRATDTVFRRAVGLRVSRAVTAVAGVIVAVDGLAALWFAAQMLARLLGSS